MLPGLGICPPGPGAGPGVGGRCAPGMGSSVNGRGVAVGRVIEVLQSAGVSFQGGTCSGELSKAAFGGGRKGLGCGGHLV